MKLFEINLKYCIVLYIENRPGFFKDKAQAALELRDLRILLLQLQRSYNYCNVPSRPAKGKCILKHVYSLDLPLKHNEYNLDT